MGDTKTIQESATFKFPAYLGSARKKISLKYFTKRISSSTLIEIIVAILLANIVFFFTFSIILNALGGNNLIKEYKSQLLANSYITKEIESRNFENKSIEWESVRLEKQVISIINNPGLSIITITITDKTGRQLAETKCFVRNE